MYISLTPRPKKNNVLFYHSLRCVQKSYEAKLHIEIQFRKCTTTQVRSKLVIKYLNVNFQGVFLYLHLHQNSLTVAGSVHKYVILEVIPNFV